MQRDAKWDLMACELVRRPSGPTDGSRHCSRLVKAYLGAWYKWHTFCLSGLGIKHRALKLLNTSYFTTTEQYSQANDTSVCVCSHSFMCRCVCVPVCACVWRSELNLGCSSLGNSHPSFSDNVSHWLAWSLLISLGWPTSESQGSECLHLPSAEITSVMSSFL